MLRHGVATNTDRGPGKRTDHQRICAPVPPSLLDDFWRDDRILKYVVFPREETQGIVRHRIFRVPTEMSFGFVSIDPEAMFEQACVYAERVELLHRRAEDLTLTLALMIDHIHRLEAEIRRLKGNMQLPRKAP